MIQDYPSIIRVLLIEDDPVTADVITRLASSDQTIAVDAVGTLREGLERIASHDYHVILLDLTLPHTEGLETFRDVQQAAGTIPIVIVSGNGDPGTIRKAMQSGAQDYIVKGNFDGPFLINSIKNAKDRNRWLGVSKGARAGQDQSAAIARIQDDIRAMKRGISHIEKVISVGNGRHSIMTRLALLEQRQMSPQMQKINWTATFAALILALVLVVIKLVVGH